MSVRFNVVLSDDLNRAIDKAAEEAETNKSEILRKALQLYLAAREGRQRGLKLGLVEPVTEKLQTEIVGL
ncbi:MAG: ribbon-helix-helix protein, CopG family [Rhodospirillales bacterium]